ncbi:MAG: hypothetical protein AAB466_07030 [Verrucomicrobiota bacterium]
MNLPMNLQVGRITPCAPQDRAWHPDGTHGVDAPYRPERVQGRKVQGLASGHSLPGRR